MISAETALEIQSLTPQRITESLSLLMLVQKLDSEMTSLHDETVKIPLQIGAIENSLQVLSEELKHEEGNVAEMQKHLRKLESELAFDEDQIKKTEAKMMAVKTNEEYRAALKEIDERKEAIAKREEEILRYMDEVEQAKGRLESFRKNYKEKETSFRAQLSTIKQRAEGIPPRVRALAEEREKTIRNIPDEVFRRYQAIREKSGNGGLAIVEIVKGNCSGCNMEVLPQLINLIIRAEQFYTCPSCHRLLTYRLEKKEKKS